MLVKDARGNKLLEVIQVDEERAMKLYQPVTHALMVVRVGDEYLLGWNHWRKNWETFGGCIDKGESLRECIIREGFEELGLKDVEYTWLGLMHFELVPDYFSPEHREEYGGLYGVTISTEQFAEAQKYRIDKEEIEKVAFYSKIGNTEKIVAIDEKLLEFWK
ncbi:MAG: NUDIX domain-containing protein [Lachnospiraceae bacterium]|nr:NUDIX domain-containing protein [Lachnospiraceae bacterium]